MEINEILLIRSNGELDIIGVGNTMLDPIILSKYKSHEILTGIDIGHFRNEQEYDIMLTSYSGLVFSLTPKSNKPNVPKKAMDKKTLQKLQKEVSEEISHLQILLKEKQKEYAMQQNQNNVNAVCKNPYKYNYKFTLIPLEAAYHLIIESEFPLEMVILSAQVKIDIMDVLTPDVSLNVISNRADYFQATCKLKGDTHIVELKLRTYEGNKDDLNATLIPFNSPKTSYILKIPIKSLPLNQRIGTEETNTWEKSCIKEFNSTEEKFINKLTIKGNHSANEFNQIFSSIMPDIPDKTSKESLKYYFQDTFLNNILSIEIENNLAIVKSRFIGSLITIKEQLTKEANFRRKNIEFNIKIEPLSIFKILEQMDPLIENNFILETKYMILQAFNEIDVNNLNLPNEYKEIIDSKEKILKEYKQRTTNLEFMRNQCACVKKGRCCSQFL